MCGGAGLDAHQAWLGSFPRHSLLRSVPDGSTLQIARRTPEWYRRGDRYVAKPDGHENQADDTTQPNICGFSQSLEWPTTSTNARGPMPWPAAMNDRICHQQNSCERTQSRWDAWPFHASCYPSRVAAAPTYHDGGSVAKWSSMAISPRPITSMCNAAIIILVMEPISNAVRSSRPETDK